MRPTTSTDSDLIVFASIAGALLLVAFVVVLFVVRGRRKRALLLADAGPPVQWPPGAAAPTATTQERLGVGAWVAAAPSLRAAGLSRLDAETFTRTFEGILCMLSVSFVPRSARLQTWIERDCEGRMIETFLGQEAQLRPGEEGATHFARFIASRAGRLLSMLPPSALLQVRAPKLPGDKYKAELDLPFGAVEHPALAARALLVLDDAARSKPPPGVRAQLPPAAFAWREAGSSLKALGLSRLDPETYIREYGPYPETLYVRLNVDAQRVSASIERRCPGGVIEAFVGQSTQVHARATATTDLGRFLEEKVGPLLARLPDATLTVKAPDIPGDTLEATVSAPLSSVEAPAATARVIIELEKAARGRVAAGAHVQVPAVALRWKEAGPMLESLGLTRLDAETYTRDFGRVLEMILVRLNARGESVNGSVQRTRAGGALERFVGMRVDLAGGEAGASPFGQFIASHVGELLAALPREARLSVKAPDIPGDKYKLSITSPFAQPEHARDVVRVLLALDRLAQRAA